MSEKSPHRPHSHIVGDIGQTNVALVFKEWGWTADLISSDYGEDLDCNIFVNQRRTAFHFRCQVKSSNRNSQYINFLKSGDISVSIETTLANFWLTSYYPVLLIVYIDDSREMYWENATQYLRKNLDKLAKKQVRIRINQKNVLIRDQSKFEKNIQEFYAQILRLSSPQLVCNVIPVIMPSYKIPRNLFWTINNRLLAQKCGLSIETIGLTPEHLPAWTTILRSMDLDCLHCWLIAVEGADLKSFNNQIIEFIEYAGKESASLIRDKEWLSFICSPIRILDKEKDSSALLSINQDVTNWWSYCYINQRIESDLSYAFDLPEDCLMPVPYNGFSWRFSHFVEPQRDLAIELLGLIPTTPSSVAQVGLFRDYILSQFLPWVCSPQAVNLLRKLLASYALVFVEIPSLSKEETTVGAICDEMFDPTIGWVLEPETWQQLESNSIIQRLDETTTVDKLPGRREDLGVTDFVLKLFGDSVNVTKNLIISKREYISGLPIDHSRRSISVQRLRVVITFDEDEIMQHLYRLRNYLKVNLDESESISTSTCILFRNFDHSLICVLSVSWAPNLYETSLESFERFSAFICQVFDEALIEVDCGGKFKRIGDILQLGAVELREF